MLDYLRIFSLINDKKVFCDSFDGVMRSVILLYYLVRVVENLVIIVILLFNFDLFFDSFYE